MRDIIKVLYLNTHNDLGGASNSLLDMMESLGESVSPIVLVPQHGELEKECNRRGIECIVTPFTSLIFIVKRPFKTLLLKPWRIPWIKYMRTDIVAFIRILRMLRGKHIDIVHTNVSDCTIGRWIAKWYGVPHVWHIRESLTKHFNVTVCGGVPRLSRLIDKADARIAVSTAIKSHWKLKELNTYVINDSIRCAGDAVYIPDKDKYFLFASFGITKLKGADLAVRAFCESGLHNAGFKLLMLGHIDAQFKTELLSIAHDGKAEQFIEFHEFTTDVKPYFAKATAFIQASVYEGLGRTPAEAMLYGCPVIATAYSGGTLDLVRDKETGYLFNTVAECAGLMRHVAFNEQKNIIINAQNWALSHWTEEKYSPKILDIYNTLLKK